MRYEVRYTDDYGYGNQRFTEEFETFEQAQERFQELKSRRWAPANLTLVDTIEEAKAKILELKRQISQLEDYIQNTI